MTRARACVYVPSLDQLSLLLKTLRSLAEQTMRADVVVADNGSSHETLLTLRREHPDAVVVELRANLGFGPAINRAVARHPAEVLLFANNDVLYEPRYVEALVDELGTSPAAVAGVLVQDEDTSLIDSAGVTVDATLLAFDYLHGEPVVAAAGAPPPLGATGGAALVPLEVFNAVGGFDQRIFAYLEDVDLALRLRAARFGCRLAPDARAIHRHSSTLGSGSAAKNQRMGWSRGYMLRRYGVLRSPVIAARALAAEAAITSGQLLIDRTATGIRGRVEGWHAARGLPPLSVPPDAPLDISLIDALGRRAARRSRRGHGRDRPSAEPSRCE